MPPVGSRVSFLARRVRAAARPAAGDSRVVPAFTRKEITRLSRTNRAIARSTAVVEIPALDAEKAAAAAEERKRYEALKVEQQLWTLGFSAAGVAMTVTAYDQARPHAAAALWS